MALRIPERRELHELIKQLYPTEADLGQVLRLALGRNIEDLTSGGTRPQKYLEVIVRADAQGWLDGLMEGLFEDQKSQGNQEALDALADVSNRIWPQGGPNDPHLHLLAASLAFVDRDAVRRTIREVVTAGTPHVLVLRGRGLAGTSYCWQLISHVAREIGSIKLIHFDLDTDHLRTPASVMKAIGLRASFGVPPSRNDLLDSDGAEDDEAPQLASRLSDWFLGKAVEHAAETGEQTWLVIDNAHRQTVPSATKDMIDGLARAVATGMADRLHLFVLGAESRPSLSLLIREDDVAPLGRPDIVAYLNEIKNHYGSLGEFATAEEATDSVTQGCDLMAPDREGLTSVTRQLTEIVRSLQ